MHTCSILNVLQERFIRQEVHFVKGFVDAECMTQSLKE
jgi:hypothetical protein